MNQTFNPPLAFDSADSDAAHAALLLVLQQRHGARRLAGSGDGDAPLAHPAERADTIGVLAGRLCRRQGWDSVQGPDDNHTCDRAPGANDGLCDACPITGGESTENEMFILIGSYYVDPTALAIANGGGTAALALPALDAKGRSTSSELALPPQLGCGASHAAHTMHAGH